MNPKIGDRRALLELIAQDVELSRLLEIVRSRLDDDPGHDLEHCLRVALWTLRLGVPAIDPRHAVAAALLHDVVNLPKSSPERARASELSAVEARRVLGDLGFASTAVEEIAEAIRDHAFSAGRTPTSALGSALQDADRLEALGALGILRTVSTGVRMGARYFDPDDPWAERRPLDDRSFSIDHFFSKLFALEDALLTDAGRAEARRRTEVLRVFVTELGREIGVPTAGHRGR